MNRANRQALFDKRNELMAKRDVRVVYGGVMIRLPRLSSIRPKRKWIKSEPA